MRTLLFFALMVSCFASMATAQEVKRRAALAPPAPRGPALLGEDDRPVAGIRLAKADIKAVVHGTLAQATMTLTFANDQPRVLGGNLVFPLPEGATVTGYGLEINGQIVEGVAVEKERARIIYEAELHKRVDPGLVEHVAGNQFRTRLYPIPANGTRSIRIEYVTRIEQINDAATLALPMGFAQAVDELSVRIDAPEALAAPRVNAGGIDGLGFTKSDHGFSATTSAKNARTGDELLIAFPELAERSVAVEKRLKTPRTIEEFEAHGHRAEATGGFADFEHYFIVNDSLVIPAARQPAQLKNKRVGIVWDASLSRSESDHARELKLLESVLNHLGNPGTDLIVIRNDVKVTPFFDATAAGTARLVEAIRSLHYDGATNLGALILPKNVSDYSSAPVTRTGADYDLFLLFSDGFGNLGADRPLRAEVPVYAMSNDLRANHSLLRAMCQESGGTYYNLTRATDEMVLAGVGDAAYSLVSVECNASEIADVYPPVGTAVSGRFTVSGRLLAPQATLTLHYGYGRQVTASQSFTLSAAGANQGSLLPRYWAQQKVAALSLFPEKNADELSRLGKQFNLVTPNTSLLVLETVDQYVQYRVVPPIERTEIYREFLARIEQTHTQEAQSTEQKLQQVVAMWNARVQWWEAEHNYPKGLVVNAEGQKGALALDDVSGRGVGAGSGADHPFAGREARQPHSITDPAGRPGGGADQGRVERDGADGTASAARDRRELHPSPVMAPPPASPARSGGPGGAAEAAAALEPRLMTRSPAPPQGQSPAPGAAPSNAPPAERDQAARAQEQAGQSLNSEAGGALDVPIGNRNARQMMEREKLSRLESQPDGLSIAIKPWDPNTPYIKAMKAAAPEKAYDVYLDQRKGYAQSPAFYFDCADYLVAAGQRELGIRVLTDIVELELKDARLLRVAAHRLNQIGERELAIDLFEKVLRLRPEEPQSYRDLALALADRADAALRRHRWRPRPGLPAPGKSRSRPLRLRPRSGTAQQSRARQLAALPGS